MFDHLRADIVAHALTEFPRESCGLIVSGVYHPCRNVASTPEEHFEISPADYVRATRSGTLEAVVHSHREDVHRAPSAQDMQGQLTTALPWVIVVTDGEIATDYFVFGDGAPVSPLVGRRFKHGVRDCYSIIRDWYWLNRKVRLKEFPRDPNWWVDGREDLYAKGFSEAGFECIATRVSAREEPQEGDVFLFRLDARVSQHAGVYVGRGLILHHLADSQQVTRLSRHEPLFRWQGQVTHWLRYVGDAANDPTAR